MLAFAGGQARAQTTVSGTVMDTEGVAVAVANVRILTASDSSMVSGTLTDDDGAFGFESVQSGTYLLYVSLIGYVDSMTNFRVDGRESVRLGVIRLAPTTIEMDEVVVRARRSFIEQKPDRLVVNVAGRVTNTGRSALEVLSRSPGVVVNQRSGTVSLIGKDGVNVMVNGRRRYVPDDALIDFLSGISADNIESIELITSPPASFEAEGKAGFINIVLKERTGTGLNGAVSLSGGVGFGVRGNGSGNVSYGRDRLYLNATYSNGTVSTKEIASLYRRIVTSGSVIETPTFTDREPVTTRHDIRFSLDYGLDDATSVGGILGAYRHTWSLDAVNRTILRSDDVDATRIRSENNEDHVWRHLMGNLHLDREVGDDASLGADVDFAYYHDRNPAEYRNVTTDVTDASVSRDLLESDKTTPLRILAAEVDYEASLAENVTISGGAKAALSEFTNNTSYRGPIVSQWIRDVGITGGSTMKEDVMAAYTDVTISPDTLSTLRAGLRFELTDTDVRSDEGEQMVDRRYGTFFPSIAFSRELGLSRTVNASYTRRVTRPSFRNLALALYFYDPYTVLMGNSALRHAITNTLKLDFSNGDLLTSVQYSWEDSTIMQFQNQVLQDENVQLIVPQNLRRLQQLSSMVAFPLELTTWWTSQNSLTAIWERAEGSGLRGPRSHDRPSYRITSTHNVDLPFDLGFEASGHYQSAVLYGLMIQEPTWVVDLGFRRQFLDGRANLTLTVNNLFDTGRVAGSQGSRENLVYLSWDFKMARRYLQLTYTLRFGDGKSAPTRTTASQEERKRADN